MSSTRTKQIRGRFLAIFLALAPAHLARADAPLAASPAVTFFSSIDGEPFARLEAAAVSPDHVRHGPFRLPAPGVRLESPVLILFDRPCSSEDWSRFLREFGAWRRPSVSDDFLITLPDGRVFVFIETGPDTDRNALSGFVTTLSAETPGEDASKRRLLRVTQDRAGRLHVALEAAPEPVSRRAPAAP